MEENEMVTARVQDPKNNKSYKNRRQEKRQQCRSWWQYTRIFWLRLRRQNKQKQRALLMIVLTPLLLKLIHAKMPYYYGPPVDVFLTHMEQPLFSKSIASCSESIRATSSQQEMAVILVGAGRADYLGQVIQSLQQQSVDNFRVYIFLDFCKEDECDQVLNLVESAVQKDPERYAYQRASENIGIARMTKWAIDAVLDDPTHVYERFLFLEDDHLIGHTYVEAMQLLLSASEHMPNVALVNGNFIDTPSNQSRGEMLHRHPYFIKERDDNCHFQIVEPMHANTDVNGHDIWAWATTRTKYKQMYPTFVKAFKEAHLDTVPYMKRNRTHIAHVMNQYCPDSGYTNWGGQDWLRACIFYFHNMTQKLQPTSRLMTYIGMRGLHMNPKVFQKSGFQTVSVEEVSKDVSWYSDRLCDGICNFRVVLTRDRWALFRKLPEKSLG